MSTSCSVCLVPARQCARPDCSRPSDASLSYHYESRTVWIEPLQPNADPSSYDMCDVHARTLRVPHGWELVDRRADLVSEPAPANLFTVGGPIPTR